MSSKLNSKLEENFSSIIITFFVGIFWLMIVLILSPNIIEDFEFKSYEDTGSLSSLFVFLLCLVGFVPFVVVLEQRKKIRASVKDEVEPNHEENSSNQINKRALTFKEIKKTLTGKNFEEVIVSLGLKKEQKNPHNKNLNKLLRDYSLEEFVKLIENESKINNDDNLMSKLAKRLDVDEEDIKEFFSKHALENIEKLATVEVLGSAALMSDNDWTNYVFTSLKSQFADGWGTLIMLLVFPKRNSIFGEKATHITPMKRLCLETKFFKEFDTKEKVVGFAKEFIEAHPSYSHIYPDEYLMNKLKSKEEINISTNKDNLISKNVKSAENIDESKQSKTLDNSIIDSDESDLEAKLIQLKSLYEKKLISKTVYDTKQKQLIDKL